ncbi:MAG TPA: hypothetical protein PLT70_02145 [bacterium]|nr:hypothetical protein [bacterium]HQN73461.1 hypothetical protein [bacterium]
MRIKANLVYFEGPFLKYFRKGERKEVWSVSLWSHRVGTLKTYVVSSFKKGFDLTERISSDRRIEKKVQVF